MPKDDDIRAYQANRHNLECKYLGKFVVFHGGQMIGTYDSFDSAAKDALQKFGDSPSLIRKVGESADTHLLISTIRSQ
jgi:hypothetical protein